jgi:thiol-disulfide isomerase/thioredoxin
MRSIVIFVALIAAIVSRGGAQQPASPTQSHMDPAAAQFDAVMGRALDALVRSGGYQVDIDSQWGALNDTQGPKGASHYRLIWQNRKYRVEVQSQGATSPDLICVNDAAHVTTLFPARKLYSQHAADSPQAAIEANKMLALSVQGSAIDILLQGDVAKFVQTQATGLKDHGDTILSGKKARHFELMWVGAKVELWFAAEGDPLLLQFVRTTSVPTGMNEHYQMACTAKFRWQLGMKPAAETFAVSIPQDAERVKEIYDALAGATATTHIDRPLPAIQLAKLDGSEIDLTAAEDKKATVLIFWATWCASSVEDMPALHKFVTSFQDRGVAFYAINVGEQPGEVRRFTAKHPLVSTVLLDPRGKASSALRISELPAIAIVAPDNTVRAILHGQSKELQGELASQLENVLTGAASSTARRPKETTARPK